LVTTQRIFLYKNQMAAREKDGKNVVYPSTIVKMGT